MKRVKFLMRFWLPPVLWAASIFIVSSFPTIRTVDIYWQDFILKKGAHMIEYGLFAILLYRAFKKSGFTKEEAGIYAVLAASLYGVSDEYHQAFTPGREPRPRDIVFDTIGAGLAIYFVWNLLPSLPPKLKDWARNWQLL